MEDISPITIKSPLAGPALKALLGFSAGILACGYLQFNPLPLFIVLFAGIIILIATHRSIKTGNILAVLVMFFSGMLACTIQNETGKPVEIPEKLANQAVKVEGFVTGDAKYFNGNTTFKLKCRFIYHEGDFNLVQGILPCTLYNKKIIICEGSQLIVQGKIKKLYPPLRKNKTRLLQNTAPPKTTYRLLNGYNSPNPVIVEERKSFFGRLRISISNLIKRYPFGGHGDLLQAMTIGDKSGLSFRTTDEFTTSGIAHILAVSGLHMGILILALNFILTFLPISRKTRFLIIFFLMLVYAGLCSFRPPIVRTFIMAVMVMGGMLFEKPKNIENTIFVALLIILAANPQSLYGPSLQLSFAAVWAITSFYSPVTKALQERFAANVHLNPGIKYILSIVIVSTLAFTATSPIIAYHFGSLPILSIFVNVIAVPLAFLIITTGMLSILLIALGTITAPLAALFSSITGIFLHMLSTLAGFVSELQYATIETGNLSIFTGCCFFPWLYILSRARGRNGFKKALLYIPLVFLLIFTWNPLLFSKRFSTVQGSVVFFDVGQGDSALIEYGNKRHFLVDTGLMSSGKSVVVPSLKNLGIEKLDGIFLSHMDSDHIGSFDYILENIRVDRIFCRESIKDSLESIYSSRVKGITGGDSIAFHEGGIAVLSPFLNPSIFRRSRITGENNNSLLLRFNVCGSQILFAGDIEENAQRLMVSWGPSLKSSVLKIPHHGAKTLHPEFVNTINPELAVISCGLNNRYGHPAKTTISTLEYCGITIMRTDKNGSIVVNFPELEVLSD